MLNTKANETFVAKQDAEVSEISNLLTKRQSDTQQMELDTESTKRELQKQYDGQLDQSEKEVLDLQSRTERLDSDITKNNKMLQEKKDWIKVLEDKQGKLQKATEVKGKQLDKKNKQTAQRAKEAETLNQNHKLLGAEVKTTGKTLGEVMPKYAQAKMKYLVGTVEQNLVVPVVKKLAGNNRDCLLQSAKKEAQQKAGGSGHGQVSIEQNPKEA